MFDDPRSDDSRDRDERDRDSRDRSIDRRDVFMEWVDLPRGLERELVRVDDHEYTLRGSESRTLSTVGAFRVVSSRDLLDHDGKPTDPRKGDLRGRRVICGGYLLNDLGEFEILLEILALKTRIVPAPVRFGKVVEALDLSG